MIEGGGLDERFPDVQRHAGVGAQAVPEDVVLRQAADVGNLARLGFQLLQADDVGLVTREPLTELSGARADAVNVPGGYLQEPLTTLS